jgi:hypothetical protein
MRNVPRLGQRSLLRDQNLSLFFAGTGNTTKPNRTEVDANRQACAAPVKTCVEGTMTTDYDPDGRLLRLDPIQIKSKHDFETQSEVAFRNETTSRIGRCDQPEVRVSYAPVGIAEVRMIGEIEGLNPELHL